MVWRALTSGPGRRSEPITFGYSPEQARAAVSLPWSQPTSATGSPGRTSAAAAASRASRVGPISGLGLFRQVSVQLLDQSVAVHAVDGAGLLDALPAGGGAAQAVHPDLHKVVGGGAVQVQDVADDGLAGDLEGLAVVVLADGIENIKHGVYPLHCIVLRTAFIIPQNPALLQVSRSQKEPPPPKAAGALLGYNLVLLDPSEAVGAVDGAVLTGLEGN